MENKKRARSAIPHLLSFGNLFAGFAAVIIALHGLEAGIVKIAKGNELMGDGNFGDMVVGHWGDSPWFYMRISVYLIIFGLFCDLFDGISARKFNTEGDFGKELDSLSDLVTFGVAPAVISSITLRLTGENQPIPWLFVAPVASFYVGCAAFRLARYNVYSMKAKNFFNGMPVPAAAFIMISLSIIPASGLFGFFGFNGKSGTNVMKIYTWIILGALMITALLQVSNLGFLKYGPALYTGKRRPVMIVLTCVILVGLIIKHEMTFLVVSLTYLVLNLIANAAKLIPEAEPDNENSDNSDIGLESN